MPVLTVVTYLCVPFLGELPGRCSLHFVVTKTLCFNKTVNFRVLRSCLTFGRGDATVDVLVRRALRVLNMIVLVRALLLCLSRLSLSLGVGFASSW